MIDPVAGMHLSLGKVRSTRPFIIQQVTAFKNPNHLRRRLQDLSFILSARCTSTRGVSTQCAVSKRKEARTARTSWDFSKSSTSTSDYQPPRSGLLSHLPASWVPFAELMRLDKPAGTLYLFFPCFFSTLLAACHTAAPVTLVLTQSALFLTGALIMRGAGCTVNDLWDRKLDPHVTRTRLRPIARGAVTPFHASAFAGFQCLAGLGVLIQFPTTCLGYGIPSLLLVATYPLAKRITHYPQFILGLTFSWGAIMGFPALDVDLFVDRTCLQAVAALYGSCVSWTVLYDMIYAHMDIKDDVKIGIKSIALRHEHETKMVLSGLATVQISLLAAAGVALDLNPLYFVSSCGSAALSLGLMIWRVRLGEPANCLWWFTNGAIFTGGGISCGLLAEYLLT